MNRFARVLAGFTFLAWTNAQAGFLYLENFSSDNGSYVGSTENTAPAWTWDGVETWSIGSPPEDGVTNKNARLTSPNIVIPVAGSVELRFAHRYSIEPSWDGAAVFLSINGGAFAQIADLSFSQNGYTFSGLLGAHALGGGTGFNGDSANFLAGDFITSIAQLGSVAAGDAIRLQFLMAFDQFAQGNSAPPSWQIDSVSLYVPEPPVTFLLALGLLGLVVARRKKSASQRA